MMVKRLFSIAKQTGMMILIGYLSLAMLTGCSTVEMRVIDPIAPVKFETPLAGDITLWVVVDYRDKVRDVHRKMWEWYQPDFLNDMEQVLITSGAFVNVQASEQCQGGRTERTLCVTVKPFNQPEASFFSSVLLVIGVVFAILLLFIPVLFMTSDPRDRVIAEAVLLDRDGKQIGGAEVSSEFEASIGNMKIGGNVFRQMWGQNNKELANRVVRELKRHPHWFEAAR